MVNTLTAKRRKKEKEQRRNLIIDAAQELFFSKQYEEITIETIAKKAKLAKGTIYLYFDSKEALYSAVALRGLRILNSMFKKAVIGKKNGLEKAFSIGEAYYDFCRQHKSYFLMSIESERFPGAIKGEINSKELVSMSGENLEILRKAVAEGIEDGSIRPNLDPLLTSIFLIQSTKAMIELTPGFELLLKQAGSEKDEVLKFTLQALRHSLQNIHSKNEVDQK